MVAYNVYMTSKALILMLGVTENFSLDVFRMVVATWCFSVGYLLFKRANRALTQQRPNIVLDVTGSEVSCLGASSYTATGA